MNRIYKNNIIIENDVVTKKRQENIVELFDYLDSRGIDNFPKIISYDENNIKTEYIKSINNYEITQGVELIETMAKLHSKTVVFSSVSKNKYKNIYKNILGNIEYLTDYYDKIIDEIENHEYMSPSQYLFARNYSALDSSLKYCKSELKKWFKIVSNNSKERVCTIHNNMSLNHFISSDKNYFVSWDKALVDTPILDIYKFYKNDGYKLDFNYLLKKYYNIFELQDNEKMMLNILISIPPKIEFLGNELEKTEIVRKAFIYIYSSMSVVNENK